MYGKKTRRSGYAGVETTGGIPAHIRKKGEKKEKYRGSRKGAEASADPCRGGAPSFSAFFHRKGVPYARTGGRVYCCVRGGKSRPASRRAGGPGASGGCFYRWKSGGSSFGGWVSASGRLGADRRPVSGMRICDSGGVSGEGPGASFGLVRLF